ncbi:UNVERIFIED_CONTAM: Leucine-rich repeat serine/threonine-protein kinase 2 [Siphonaria sp. JEL0065]|nr:Leucine-rich repeat serine/threonine-protein kinase 2 [Siphonaria sp. JEL0065]
MELLRAQAIQQRNECLRLEALFNECTDIDQLPRLEQNVIAAEGTYNKLVLELKALESQAATTTPPPPAVPTTPSRSSSAIATSPRITSTQSASSSNNTPTITQDGIDAPDWTIFMSYCWKNSRDAYKQHQITTDEGCGSCDPRDLARKLTAAGYSTWLDVDRLEGGEPLYEHLVDAIKPSKFAVICVSSEYATSENCIDEFKFIRKIKIPKIIVVVGPKGQDDWSTTVVGFMAGDSLYIDTQGPSSTDMPDETFNRIIAGIKRGIQHFQVHGYQSTLNLHSQFTGEPRINQHQFDMADVAGLEAPPPPGSRWLKDYSNS